MVRRLGLTSRTKNEPGQAKPGRWSVWRWLGEPELDQRFAGRIRKEQLGAILRLTPAMMLANLVNGGVLLYAFWDSAPRIFLPVWFLALCLTIALGVRAWCRSRHRPTPHTVSVRGVRRAVWHAFTLASVWAAVPINLFLDAGGPERLLLAVLMTGMIAAGGFGLSTVPPAAFVYSVIMLSSSFLVLFMSAEPVYLYVAVLLVSYGLIIGRGILWHANLFVERLQHQFDLEQQREVIGLLLRDFEESASDWLWETDDQGRLQHVSRRLAEVLGRSEETLQGQRLVDLLTPRDGEADAGDDDMRHSLFDCLTRRAPFRDRVIAVALGSERRFWSLTAKPVYDVQHVFKGYRGVGTDVTDQTRAERQLAYLAHIDPLTDLANRSCLDTRLKEAFEGLERWGEGFALICLDLDGFKAVNDKLGHGAGDRLLELVGKRLRRCARDIDTVARIGGDEFAVLQKATDQPAASSALASRLVDALSTRFDVDGRRVLLGASVGVAIAGRDGHDPATLMKHADLALYRSKREGRGCFCHYEPDMGRQAEAPKVLERDLPAALASGDIDVHFQPMVRLGTGQVTGLEALLRWRHRERGMLAPAVFLPMAEETGLIADLGNFVIERACEASRDWPARVRIAINLSPVQLRNAALQTVIIRALAAHDIEPDRLEIEVSEAVFADDGADLLAILRRLQDQGIRIALDRFGTGSSPLGHLCRFPFDRIKLDPLYLDGAGTDKDRTAILRAIIDLAGSLGMATTAEGVETASQLRLLRAEHCTDAQGFVICPPKSLTEVADFLQHWSGWTADMDPLSGTARNRETIVA